MCLPNPSHTSILLSFALCMCGAHDYVILASHLIGPLHLYYHFPKSTWLDDPTTRIEQRIMTVNQPFAPLISFLKSSKDHLLLFWAMFIAIVYPHELLVEGHTFGPCSHFLRVEQQYGNAHRKTLDKLSCSFSWWLLIFRQFTHHHAYPCMQMYWLSLPKSDKIYCFVGNCFHFMTFKNCRFYSISK